MANYQKYQKTSYNNSSKKEPSLISKSRKIKVRSKGNYGILSAIERLDPNHTPWYSKKLLNEHLSRYRLAVPFCKEKTVIELGCGSGYGTKLIAKSGAKKVYGIDIDELTIKYAKKFYSHKKITFIKASAMHTKLPKNIADVIISFETIEHVTNPSKMITEINRILKPGGLLIISTPNKAMSLDDNPYHIKEFMLTELDSLLNGFTDLKYFGQGKSIISLIKIYQKLINKKMPTQIKRLFHLRPWEGFQIYPITLTTKQSYVYIISICRKKSTQK